MTLKPQKYPPPRVIAVDVDSTLQVGGVANAKLIDWCRARKAAGFTLVLWSSRGEAHAKTVAKKFGVAELFTHILSKPGYVVDDQGWGWIKYTRVVSGWGDPSC